MTSCNEHGTDLLMLDSELEGVGNELIRIQSSLEDDSPAYHSVGCLYKQVQECRFEIRTEWKGDE